MLDIFVIVPYTHADEKIVEERVRYTDLYVGFLTSQCKVVYSTVSAMHHITKLCELPTSYDYWKLHCEKMIASTYEVHVLCLDGWEDSEGVQAELEFAKLFSKKIKYVTPMGKDDARVYITSDYERQPVLGDV